MKKVLSLLVVSSMILSIFCFTSQGMGQQLEKSLFLSNTAWLNERIRSEIGEKIYKNGLSKIKKCKNLKADIDHLIAVHYDLEGTLTDSNNIAKFIIPLKPETGEKYTEINRSADSANLTLCVKFKNPQIGQFVEADFDSIMGSGSVAFGRGIRFDDEKFSEALAEKAAEEGYSWLDEANVTRSYFIVDDCWAHGYLLTDGGSHKIVWLVDGDPYMCIPSETFVSVGDMERYFEEVKTEARDSGYYMG